MFPTKKEAYTPILTLFSRLASPKHQLPRLKQAATKGNWHHSGITQHRENCDHPVVEGTLQKLVSPSLFHYQPKVPSIGSAFP